MGTVYRARQKSFDRPVAIKILNPDKCNMHRAAAQRVLREGRAIARLKHPHAPAFRFETSNSNTTGNPGDANG
jgi:serine/threonine protein kinase